ncbi:MAG: hypothetical protein RL095_1031 [Verrucomicrobiota bacterium]|jgi:hypothetical protein
MPFLNTSSSEFRKLRESGAYLVDKSMIVRDLLDAEDSILIARPRRFGKTINMSLMQEFFRCDKQDHQELFKGMKILDDAKACEHMGKHPVIFITLKDWQPGKLTELQDKLTKTMAELISHFDYALPSLNASEIQGLELVQKRQGSLADLQDSLRLLGKALHLHWGQPPVIIVDEYDSPIHAAYEGGFYPQAIKFLRPWFAAAFKGNENLFKGVLTGILRISKESLFSGLNNIKAYTLLSSHSARFQDKFGFTEAEVGQFLCDFGKADHIANCRAWYNGYTVGDAVGIYNPYSIANFVADVHSRFQAHWVNTSGNVLIWTSLEKARPHLQEAMQKILAGEAVRIEVNEATALSELPSSAAVWSLFVHSGYLKASEGRCVDGQTSFLLELPNFEMIEVFRGFVTRSFEKVGLERDQMPFVLLRDDKFDKLEKLLREYFLACGSYYDLNQSQEQFIHGLFFGIAVHLRSDYLIESNPESGEGRADILMIPRNLDSGLSAKIIEFKIAKGRESLKSALAHAFQQIDSKDYAAKVREAGCLKLTQIGIATKGKSIAIEVRRMDS